MSFSTGYDDKYVCPICEIKFSYDDAFDNEWKCPTCANYLNIEAPNLMHGVIKNRIKAKDVKKQT